MEPLTKNTFKPILYASRSEYGRPLPLVILVNEALQGSVLYCHPDDIHRITSAGEGINAPGVNTLTPLFNAMQAPLITNAEKTRTQASPLDKTQGYQGTIIHAILRFKLLEILRWTISRETLVPIQVRESRAPEPGDATRSETKRAYEDGITNWLETSKDMVQEFLKDMDTTPPAQHRVEDHTLSLLRAARGAVARQRVEKIIANVSGAALALRALLKAPSGNETKTSLIEALIS